MITAGTSEITKRAAATRRQRNTQDPSFSELLGHALEHHWKPRCRTSKQQMSKPSTPTRPVGSTGVFRPSARST